MVVVVVVFPPLLVVSEPHVGVSLEGSPAQNPPLG